MTVYTPAQRKRVLKKIRATPAVPEDPVVCADRGAGRLLGGAVGTRAGRRRPLPPRQRHRMMEEHANTIREALEEHVPDGYDQVPVGWEGPLLREALDSLAALLAEHETLQADRDRLQAEVDAANEKLRALGVAIVDAALDQQETT